ncbi:hypothetical protein [Rufibacter sp. LB8]|nr:hypothetical protein [Rufibacter sp. LB8]
MRQFLGNSLWSGVSTVTKAGSTLIINKLLAVYYGPNGITLLAHFLNLIAILTTLSANGINTGLLRHLAQNEPGSQRYRAFFWGGAFLNLGLFLMAVLAVLVFSDFFLERFKGQETNLGWLPLLFFLLVVLLFWHSLLLARQALRAYVGINFLSGLTSVAAVWWAAGSVDLVTVLLLFLAGQAVGAVVGAVVALSQGLIPKLKQAIPKLAYQELGKYGLMAVATLVGAHLVDFAVREMAIERFSMYETGLWQSVVRISDSYTVVFLSVLSMVYYPKIASLLNQPSALREYVRSIFLLLVPLVGVALLVVSWQRDFFIQLLFQKEFLAARDLMDYQLLGDFLKMTTWILSYIVTVQARVKLFIASQLGSGMVYVALVSWAVPTFGLEGLPLAHFLRFALYFLFYLYLFRSYFISK